MRFKTSLGCLVAVIASVAIGATPVRGEDAAIKRYLFGSLHTLGDFHAKKGETFPDPLEQGLFVYDINDGHKLVKSFPAKSWKSWSGGWAGLAAHAASGVLFQVQDGGAVRAYDILGEKLLWETPQAAVSKILKEADGEKRQDGFTKGKFAFDIALASYGDSVIVRYNRVETSACLTVRREHNARPKNGMPVLRRFSASPVSPCCAAVLSAWSEPVERRTAVAGRATNTRRYVWQYAWATSGR